MDILVLNCGSSSAKFAVIDSATGKEKASGLAERLGAPGSQLVVKNDGDKSERALPENASHEQALRAVVEVLHELGLAEGIKGVGHRVVHGGATFTESVAVDAAVKRDIEACFRLAPLHNPPNLTGIEVAEELFPSLTNVAVFDTAFHATMPRKAYMYAVPYELYEEQGVRRYGFHGTSHRYVAGKALAALGLSDDPQSGLVTAHLGNGCSATAVAGGESVDTSMGLTPLEGLVMGTRSGDIDPALIGYLEDNKGWSAKETISVLNKKSGLLGLSGVSNDMRTVVGAAKDGNERAALAIDVFCYRLAKYIGALVAALPRFDALVFTGGIGENNPVPIREKVCGELCAFGLELDEQRNLAHGVDSRGVISPEGRRPAAMVIPTDEELMIATDTARIIAG